MSRLHVLIYALIGLLGFGLLWFGVSVSPEDDSVDVNQSINFQVDVKVNKVYFRQFDSVFKIVNSEQTEQANLAISKGNTPLFTDSSSKAITLKGFCLNPTNNTPFLLYKAFDAKTGLEFFRLVEMADVAENQSPQSVNAPQYFNIEYQDELPVAPIITEYYKTLPLCLDHNPKQAI